MGAADNLIVGLVYRAPNASQESNRCLLDAIQRFCEKSCDVIIAGDFNLPGLYPLPEMGRELRRLAPGEEHRSTGHELAIGLDGPAWYVGPDERFRPAAETFIVTTPDSSPA